MKSEVLTKLAAAGLLMVSVLFSRYFLENRPVSSAVNRADIQISNETQRTIEGKSITQKSLLEEEKIVQKEATQEQNSNSEIIIPDINSVINDNVIEYLSIFNSETVETLSKEEIFKLQHPKRYLDYLSDIENLMIEDEFLSGQEKQEFTAESQVLDFWKQRGFPYMLSLNVVTEADRTSFEKGLHKVRIIHLEEARHLRNGLGLLEIKAPLKVNLVIEQIKQMVSPTAYAQSPLCFVPGPPTKTPGINLIAPCCNCFAGFVPIGCLNAICVGRPAIYDQTTFICGCSL